MEYTCARCNKKFNRQLETRRKSWQKLCSRICSNAYKKEMAQIYADKVKQSGKKQCKQCGKYLLLNKFPPSKQSKIGYFAYCRPCTREKMRITDKKRADKRKIYSRTAYLKRTYNMSQDEYNKLLEQQNGSCFICSSSHHLNIDHCHKTGNVRGILCDKCNKGLGFFQDNHKFLSNAIKYLS